MRRSIKETPRDSDYRFQRLCDAIQNSEGNIDLILETLGSEIVKFQNDTVAIFLGVLGGVFSGERTSDLGSMIYSFSGDLWLSGRESYLSSLQRRKLTDKHRNVHNAITDKIQESMGQFDVFVAGGREIAKILLGETKQEK